MGLLSGGGSLCETGDPPAPRRSRRDARHDADVEDSPLRSTTSNPRPLPRSPLAGDSARLRHALDLAARAAATALPIHVRGESGTGKERLARWIHACSPRRDRPFIAVNCAAVTESLLEAELFGATRGAYTGADRDRPGLVRLADRGTLFLDEIGDMPRSLQAALLRTIQEGRVRPVGGERETPVDVRWISATHRDLAAACRDGRFREDLWFRVAVIEVELPPLRERLADLPALVAALAPRLADDTGLPPPRLEGCALRALRGCSWRGNVRQLHAVLARAMLRAEGGAIRAEHLGGLDGAPPGGDGSLERAMIDVALAESGGRVAEAARRIGWSRQKLYRRLRATEERRGPHPSSPPTTSSKSSTFQ